jgi:hypothetical protein
MMVKGYEYQSDFAKKYVAQRRPREMLSSFGCAPGCSVPAPDAAREPIVNEQDSARLERAIVAASVAEVLDDPSRGRPRPSAHRQRLIVPERPRLGEAPIGIEPVDAMPCEAERRRRSRCCLAR